MRSGEYVGEVVPIGTQFEANGRNMMLVLDNEPQSYLRGWLLENKNGRWYTFRLATDRDISKISAAVVKAHHS